jgi:crossover junction endodeoxyribonuclease RuvC
MGYALLGINGKKPQLIVMGVLQLSRMEDHYMRLRHIYERVSGVIAEYLPDEMAIEAPFFGKNVQSMLKLGRAQGTAIAAAIHHGVPIHEYAPMKIKMALTGNGGASKEQVAGMLQRLLKIPNEEMGKFMDATDALAAAYCHYMQMGRPESDVKYRGWKDFVNKNQDKISKQKK